jgi:hypothetical protein
VQACHLAWSSTEALCDFCAAAPYSERGLDERHSRNALMAYVANVIDEQLHDLDRQRRAARRQAQWRIRQQCPFGPVH